MSTVNHIFQALQQKCGFEVVVQTEETNRLRIVGRVHNTENWKLVIYRLLNAAYDRPWSIDISKSIFLKKKDGEMVFGWRIILQSEDVAKHYADITNLVHTAPISARTEVTEMPLPGSNAGRNSTAGGKRGAGPSGSVPVGPMAAMQKNAGG